MGFFRRMTLRLFFSKKELLTILACLESKKYNTQDKLDSRVPMDENNKSIMTIIEMLSTIEKIKKIIKEQM